MPARNLRKLNPEDRPKLRGRQDMLRVTRQRHCAVLHHHQPVAKLLRQIKLMQHHHHRICYRFPVVDEEQLLLQ